MRAEPVDLKESAACWIVVSACWERLYRSQSKKTMNDGAVAAGGGGGGGGGSLLVQAARADAVANARKSFLNIILAFPPSVGRAADQNGERPSWFRLVTKKRLIWLY